MILIPFIRVNSSFSDIEKSKNYIINCQNKVIEPQVKKLWEKVPVFKRSMGEVPIFHIPNNKSLIEKLLDFKAIDVKEASDSSRSLRA
jgi:hypothetical protein